MAARASAVGPYDIAVVGSGVVGATLACLLADGGLNVAVVAGIAKHPAHDEPYDLRTYSLTPASRRILSAAGVWPRLAPERIAAYHGMRVWDAADRGAIEFDAALCGRSTLGYILEQSNLLAALQGALRARPAITQHTGLVETLLPGTESTILRFNAGRQIAARVVAACDGADSSLRALVGIDVETIDYLQDAVVANVRTTLPHGSVARQRFLESGPLAFLPLPAQDWCSVVWSTGQEEAGQLLEMDDTAFTGALGRAFDYALGDILACSRRLRFPLRRCHARQYSAERVVLVGDAAHLMHPLAGQGMNVGLLDAAVLAECVATAATGALRFPRALLQRYERRRRGEVMLMLEATDKLQRLFAQPHPMTAWLRGSGLRLTNRLPVLKRLLMAHAMGDAGDLPAIARPARDAMDLTGP